jgi:hypothetical protein
VSAATKHDVLLRKKLLGGKPGEWKEDRVKEKEQAEDEKAIAHITIPRKRKQESFLDEILNKKGKKRKKR